MLDTNDFKIIFDKYFDSIRRYIYYRCGDMSMASDIAQDVFTKVWEKSDDLELTNIKSLLYKMAHDMFINCYHRESKHIEFEQTMRLKVSFEESPEEQIQYQELTTNYSDALNDMPELQRTIFLMSRNEGLKYSEIAKTLCISVKTVEKWMSVALKQLRDKLLVD
ncbi:RNA polymerase sigma factor [Massilibacteroides vaginae]|uniref:RNA polymerase sigma factor n=1 Tax=Massilibacteroides vaginae TaxID=1673718 RepID=UPI000A1CACF1|nr:RNA polymerase sigma-70 factor [Massilibacteroides vaginae]